MVPRTGMPYRRLRRTGGVGVVGAVGLDLGRGLGARGLRSSVIDQAPVGDVPNVQTTVGTAQKLRHVHDHSSSPPTRPSSARIFWSERSALNCSAFTAPSLR